MPVAAAVGDTLVSLEQLERIGDHDASRFEEVLSLPDLDPGASFALPGGGALESAVLRRAHEAATPTNPFEGIGLGKPLTVTIETIYTGDYPDTFPGLPGSQQGDVVVSSAHKSFETFAGAPRAIHLLEPKAARRAFIRAEAVSQGSQLVFYTPSVTDMSILFTVELSADRDVDDKLGKALREAFDAAGALPVFAPAAPVLITAGAAIPIAIDAARLLTTPSVFFRETVELNFTRPGVPLAQPGALVLFQSGSDNDTFIERYKLGDGYQLRDAEGKPYRGWRPYAVLTLDGTPHENLKDWSAQAMSAELVKRFYEPDAVIGQALGVATKGLSLYNDVVYRDKAAAEKKAAAAATGAVQARHQALYEAFLKNIKDEAIRDSVK